MPEDAQDQIVFVTKGDGGTYFKTVPANTGERFAREIMRSDDPWIEVDDLQWIHRGHVLRIYVSRSDESSVAIV